MDGGADWWPHLLPVRVDRKATRQMRNGGCRYQAPRRLIEVTGIRASHGAIGRPDPSGMLAPTEPLPNQARRCGVSDGAPRCGATVQPGRQGAPGLIWCVKTLPRGGAGWRAPIRCRWLFSCCPAGYPGLCFRGRCAASSPGGCRPQPPAWQSRRGSSFVADASRLSMVLVLGTTVSVLPRWRGC